ncbi:TIGR03915 family putative DNA repair protein [Salinicola avicenniae]|uniref:TIGR03915 family putative DNA repair protein n=1 Tax=Salinicola avicenniae TaxID=2916836 RepID=UPI002074090D|nr:MULTISPECIES: TIGR03915 family putative DNA repair protein [unclassified Salinicola]
MTATRSDARHVARATDFTEWRQRARQLLQAGIQPADITWQDGDALHDDLFATPAADSAALPPADRGARLTLSRDQLALLEQSARYRDDACHDRWSLLYRIVWRLARGDTAASHPADSDGSELHRRAHAVRREAHHMHAFLRFHREAPKGNVASGDEASGDETSRDIVLRDSEFLAWFEPAHDVLDLGAEHFADRLGSSRFLIATPRGGVAWNGHEFDYRMPCPVAWAEAARTAMTGDDDHALWRAYFVSTFNPARLNSRVMTQHMPQRFWRQLSEGDLIPTLEAGARHGGQRLAQVASVGQRDGKPISLRNNYVSHTLSAKGNK